MDLKGKYAIVTGVSKGIGKEVCLQLLAEGAHVYGLGRNNSIDHPHFKFIQTDVGNVSEVEAAYKLISEETKGIIHVLVNNAGLGYFGKVEELPLEQWSEMFSTNVNGVFYNTRLAVPMMKNAGFGHIFNISSTAGLDGMPQVSAYCASKWAVRGFSESLWRELRNDKIKVTCVYPGSVKTDFFRNSPDISAHDYMLMPEDLASAILYALKTPENFHQVNLEIRPLQPKGPK